MMRKLLLIPVLLLIALCMNAQDLPYSKLVNMGNEDLVAQKFKYDEAKNCWILKKVKVLKFKLMPGDEDDLESPDKNDYIITIQKGANNETAFVNVKFYNDETYHQILEFANDNGSDIKETNSGALDKIRFKFDDKNVVLEMKKQGVTNTSSSGSSRVVDNSYNTYTYTINTGVEPCSPFLDKQNKKQQSRDDKGKKKQTVNEFM